MPEKDLPYKEIMLVTIPEKPGTEDWGKSVRFKTYAGRICHHYEGGPCVQPVGAACVPFDPETATLGEPGISELTGEPGAECSTRISEIIGDYHNGYIQRSQLVTRMRALRSEVGDHVFGSAKRFLGLS